MILPPSWHAVTSQALIYPIKILLCKWVAFELPHRLADLYGTSASFSPAALKIQNMLKNHHLAKAISDRAWGLLIRNMILRVSQIAIRNSSSYCGNWKSESADKVVLLADPRNTDQSCSNGDAKVPKDLSARGHVCPHC